MLILKQSLFQLFQARSTTSPCVSFPPLSLHHMASPYAPKVFTPDPCSTAIHTRSVPQFTCKSHVFKRIIRNLRFEWTQLECRGSARSFPKTRILGLDIPTSRTLHRESPPYLSIQFGNLPFIHESNNRVVSGPIVYSNAIDSRVAYEACNSRCLSQRCIPCRQYCICFGWQN